MPFLRDVPELHFLTLEELQIQVSRYTYRPGWTLSVFMDPWEGPCLYIVADVPDAFNEGKTVELRVRSNIPPIPSAQYFSVWLQWRLAQMESHESREFFRHRETDRPVYNPHDPYELGGKEHNDDLA